MRYAILIICLFLCCVTISLDAQDTIKEGQSSNLPLTKRPLKSTIMLIYPADTIIGSLYQLKDTSILVSSSIVKKNYHKGKYEIAELYIDDINLIKQKRRVGPGVLIGAAVGAAAGAVATRIIIGPPPYSTGWLWPDTYTYAFLVPVGALAGIATGAIIGSIRISIPINGSMENYNNLKKKLGRYTIKYPGAPTY